MVLRTTQDGEWSAQEILEGIRNWAEGHHYDILVKTLSAFCLRPESLPEFKLKSCGLISRLHNVEFMVCYSWKCLCRSTMKKSKWYGKKYKLDSLERKCVLASLMSQTLHVLEERLWLLRRLAPLRKEMLCTRRREGCLQGKTPSS